MIEIGIGFDGPEGVRAWEKQRRGRYIAIEGDEGAGKTTQADLLVKWLIQNGQPAQLVREPGGDPFGEALRRVIKDPALEHEADEELFVFTAARLGMRRRVVMPLLEQGIWVVTDRSELSTFVYQGLAGGLELDSIISSQEAVAAVCRPDQFLILDIPLDTSIGRLADRGEEADVFEKRGPEYRQRVNSGYRALPALLGDFGFRMHLLDGDRDVDFVHGRITEYVRPWLMV